MKNPDKMKELIYSNPDFIAIKRYGYSLSKLEQKFPDGCDNKIIASALQISEEEVENLYLESIMILRDKLNVKV